MKITKTAALAATFAVMVAGAALAEGTTLDNAGRANTADPNSAPMAQPSRPVQSGTDAAARANTDPNSSPTGRGVVQGQPAPMTTGSGAAVAKDPINTTAGDPLKRSGDDPKQYGNPDKN